MMPPAPPAPSSPPFFQLGLLPPRVTRSMLVTLLILSFSPGVTLSPQIPSQLAGLLGEGRRAQQLTAGLKQQIIFSQAGGQSLRSGCGQGWPPPKAPWTALPASSSF